jgi:Uri superfamily endonuclease
VRKIIDVKSGIYILEIFAGQPFQLLIKKFSGVKFDKGYYYYVGSAQKNFYHRIKRHLRKNKKIHWHIDHITTIPSNKIIAVYYIKNGPKNMEIKIANDMLVFPQITIPAKGFGNSDNPEAESHLFYSKTKNHFSHFISRYQSMVRFIPSSKDVC